MPNTVGSTRYLNSVPKSKEYSVTVVSIKPCGIVGDEVQFPFPPFSVTYSTEVQFHRDKENSLELDTAFYYTFTCWL